MNQKVSLNVGSHHIQNFIFKPRRYKKFLHYQNEIVREKKINEKLDIPMRILTRFIQFFVNIKDFLSASQTIKILSQFHF